MSRTITNKIKIVFEFCFLMHAWMAMIYVMTWIRWWAGTSHSFINQRIILNATIECHIIFNNRDTPTIPNKWKQFNFLWIFISLTSYHQPDHIRCAINFIQFLHISNYRLLLLKREKRLNSGTTYEPVTLEEISHIFCCFHLVLFIVIIMIAFRMTFHYISPTDSLFHYIIN